MYLIFDTYDEMDARNRKAIIDLGYPSGTTIKKWKEIELEDGRFALDVKDGRGLSEIEKENCVDSI